MDKKWVPWTANMVDDELVAVILEKIRPIEYKKGQTIFHQGENSDNYFLLLNGRVEVSMSNNQGKKKIISIHEPKCFFGEIIMDKAPRLASAVCLTNVTVAMLNTSFSLGSEYLDKKLFMSLFYSTNFKLRIQLLQLSEHVFDEVEDRVEKLLLGLCSNFGQETDKHSFIDLPVTHQMIADIVGSSRVRVSQIISDLSKKEKIKLKRNGITMKKD